MATEWTPELTLNNDLLDRQHVELFRWLRDAVVAADDYDPAAVGSAVGAFSDALLEHIATEESLMDETLFPERGRHRHAHEMFVADLVLVRAELAARGLTPAVEEWVRVRAGEWLRFHIQTNDAPFGDHLARRRESGPVNVAGRDLRRPS